MITGCNKEVVEPEPLPEPLPSLDTKFMLTVNGVNCFDTTYTITCEDNRQFRRSENYGGGLNDSGYYKNVRQTFYLETPCFKRSLRIFAVWAGPKFSDRVSYSLAEAIQLEQSSPDYEFYALISFSDTNDVYWTNVSQDARTNEFERLDSLASNDLAYSITNDFCTETEEDDKSLFMNGVYDGQFFTNSYAAIDTSLDVRLELRNLYIGNFY